MFKITVYIKSFSQNDNKEIDTEIKQTDSQCKNYEDEKVFPVAVTSSCRSPYDASKVTAHPSHPYTIPKLHCPHALLQLLSSLPPSF